jgi:hypothetical protein
MTLDLDDILESAEYELKSQLEIRSVWNSDRRQTIQQDIERLEVDFCLRQLLKRHPSLTV